MNQDRCGALWPLALVLVLTVSAAFANYMLWALDIKDGAAMSYWLLVGAAILAIILYVPRIWLNAKVPAINTMDARVAAIHQALLGAQGNADQLARLTTSVKEIGSALDTIRPIFAGPQGNPDKIAALSTLVADLKTQISALNSKLGGLDDVRARLAAVEAKVQKL